MERSSEFKLRFFAFYRIFIPFFGICVGLVKVVGVKGEVELFRAFGVSDMFRVIFGLVQAGGASMLFFPKLIRPGAYICITTLVAASCFMIYHGILNVLAIPVVGIFLLWGYTRIFTK
ncbi:MAG: hypothetical protein KJ737_22400 [Proteobacteria bacterium]|nr:hypothetical protein [Pseudomonadota bacterium]